MGEQLTPATTFTSVALLNLLIGPLNAFPWILNGLMEAFVSLKRVQELIDLENLDLSSYYAPMTGNFSKRSEDNPVVLSVKNGSFCFHKKRDRTSDGLVINDIQDFKLERVNIEIHKGELVCIEGTVGTGKSSLINAILGNMKKVSGNVSLHDTTAGFGFVSQNPWLQRGTIRDNICWGSVFDESKYHSVINCCALREDIDKLGGDNVGVGEGGRALSGGKKLNFKIMYYVFYF